jgi:hypothetical protein
MRSARTAAAGVLFCLVLPACGVFDKQKETTDTPKRVPPHLASPPGTPAPLPGGTVAMAEPYPVASSETAVRQPTIGTLDNLSWENGKTTAKPTKSVEYANSSNMSFVSGDNGSPFEFRPVK